MPDTKHSRERAGDEATNVKPDTKTARLAPPPSPKRLRPRASGASLAFLASTPGPSSKRAKTTKPKAPRRVKASTTKLEDRASSGEDDGTVSPSYPSAEEWNDKDVFVRYKTCQLNGQQWATGDFVDIRANSKPDDDSWIAKILHIRAAGGSRVFWYVQGCVLADEASRVDWVYTTHQMLVEAGCSNPPPARIVQFPNEVVLGTGESLSELISIQCINDSARVAHLDESDPLQQAIPYDGQMFYRSRFRPVTEAEVKKVEEAVKKKGAAKIKINTKMHNAKLPIHEFEHSPTCKCEQPYIPLPPGAGSMLYCPRRTCIERLPKHRVYGAEAVTSLLESGLHLLELDRQTERGDYLCQEALPEDDDGLPTSYFTSIPQDERGIPYVLRHSAESSITRGTMQAGMVGTARPILEARDLYRSLLATIDAEAAKEAPALAVKRGRGKGTAAMEDPEKFVESWNPQTRKKLGIWLRLFGGQVDVKEETFTRKRKDCWVCPGCQRAV